MSSTASGKMQPMRSENLSSRGEKHRHATEVDLHRRICVPLHHRPELALDGGEAAGDLPELGHHLRGAADPPDTQQVGVDGVGRQRRAQRLGACGRFAQQRRQPPCPRRCR
jgi:hypothetical protein